MNGTNCSKFKKHAAAIAVASCLSLAPWVTEAAGLGKLTVLSGLGQPLRAEMEIGANKSELVGMTARLAPEDAFRQAGVDYSSALQDLRFSVEKRSNGRSVVKVTSARPVNEPFLDFLVELNWPAGRLVREYTFLLDPPEMAAKQLAKPVAPPRVVEKKAQADAAVVERPAPVKPVPAPKVATTESSPPAERNGEGRNVRTGDTLHKIAAETQYEGVSLEQMLVGIFQKNPDAFSGKNMNRLKAGSILGLPEKEEVAAIAPAEAKKVLAAQSNSWHTYREKLATAAAASPAKADATAAQASTGKITAKVEEKTSPAEQAKDKVKVSTTELAAKGAGNSAQSEADRIAKDRSLKEAQERLVMLEKNVGELQKLVEIKNQQLAELQKQPAKDAVKPVEPAKPVEAVKPLEEPKVADVTKPVEETKPAEEVKPAEVKTETPPVSVEPPKAPEPVPVPPVQPAPPVEEVQPEPESSMLDGWLLPLAGGGGVLALIAGYFLFRRRDSSGGSLTTAAPGPSSLGPNSVFRMTGGQSVDTGNIPLQTGDFSQTGPGTIDTDEVDPVAEADVYMAYGRDTQAEEILLEALQKDPHRTAIHAKLLEIYANRRSMKQFETLATELYAQTGGVGPEWEKVAAHGVVLDPGNPLYSGGKAQSPAFDQDATMIVTPNSVAVEQKKPVADVVQAAVVAPVVAAVAVAAPVVAAAVAEMPAPDAVGLDFDLGSSDQEDVGDLYVDTVVTPEADALDFDLDDSAQAPAPQALDVAGFVSVEKPAAGMPDFSPEGTLVMPSDAGANTYVGLDGLTGNQGADHLVVDEPSSVDLDVGTATSLHIPATAAGADVEDPKFVETVVNAGKQMRDLQASDIKSGLDAVSSAVTQVPAAAVAREAVDPKLVQVPDDDSLEFDVNLTDSVFLGQPMMPSEFDMGSINLDLTANTPASAPAGQSASGAPVHDAHWDEVNTKLDLAKAYEEMGDLEGARELLQEVLGEGPVELVEQARAILGRIGE